MNKEDVKGNMNESSRLSGSGIPKPTAAVKGTAKPTNSVAPMLILKQQPLQPLESQLKPVANIDPLIEGNEKSKEVTTKIVGSTFFTFLKLALFQCVDYY